MAPEGGAGVQGLRWSTTRAGPSRWPPSDDGMGFELFVPLGRGPFLEGIPPLLMAIGPASITSREQQLNKEGHIGRAIGRDPCPSLSKDSGSCFKVSTRGAARRWPRSVPGPGSPSPGDRKSVV